MPTIPTDSPFVWDFVQRPYHYDAPVPRWEEVQRVHEYEDKSRSFNILNTTAPREWRLIYTGVPTAWGEDFDTHHNYFKFSESFSFTAKDGVTYTDVYYKEYSRSHEGHLSKYHTVEIVFIKYP